MARVPINGSTLMWAREVMHLDEQEIASAAGTTLEKVRSFESGEVMPTLKQLEKLAKKLDRSMAFFSRHHLKRLMSRKRQTSVGVALGPSPRCWPGR